MSFAERARFAGQVRFAEKAVIRLSYEVPNISILNVYQSEFLTLIGVSNPKPQTLTGAKVPTKPPLFGNPCVKNLCEFK